MDSGRVRRLENPIKHYDWGSRTAIPKLLGQDGSSAEPCAELWMGAHPDGTSQLPDCDQGLDAWIARDPEAALGASVAERFDGALPFLFKVLAAEAPLSVQAHPNREQAREGFARDEQAGIPRTSRKRRYKDANHKPELVCALEPFDALNRFREPAEVAERFAALDCGILSPSVAALGAQSDRAGLETFFAALYELAKDEREKEREQVVRDAAAWAGSAGGDDPAARWVVELTRRHPGDLGALAPLLLNVVRLAPGEAMYLPAGELHSYLAGTAVEIMASSDNVLRGGLTTKLVDPDELARVLTFRSGPVEVLRPVARAPGEHCYETPAEEFELARLDVEGALDVAADHGVEILLCTRGSGRLAGTESVDFAQGGSFFVPAVASGYRLEGTATLYRARVGAPTRA